MIQAIKTNNIERVRSLLFNPSLNPGANENEAIQLAAEYGHVEIVEMLLADERVNPTQGYVSITIGESRSELREDVDANLLELGVHGPLISAIARGHVRVVELLLRDSRVNFDSHWTLPLEVAVLRGQVEVAKLLLPLFTWLEYPFNIAIQNNDFDMIRMFQEYENINLDAALQHASCYNHPDVIRVILQDVRINTMSKKLALELAASRGYTDIVAILLNDPYVRAGYTKRLSATINNISLWNIKTRITINTFFEQAHHSLAEYQLIPVIFSFHPWFVRGK